MRRLRKTRPRSLRAALALVPLLAAAGLANAQDEWEWEPDEGYHEEEWYDPSDWFNEDDEVSYEYDWDDYGYDYDYDYDYGYDDEYYEYDDDPYSDFGTTLYDDYGTSPDSEYERAPDYGWHYEWNPVTNRWETEYGWHESLYDGGAGGGDMDYGWYYVWNSQQDDWEREYGWHESQYQYDTQESAAGRMQMGQQGQQQRGQQDRMAQQQGQQGQMGQRRQQGQMAQQGQSGQQRQQGQMGQMGQMGQQGRMAQQQQQRGTTVRGSVAGFNRMPVEGEVHTLVRLRTDQGATRVIDLGPDAELSRLDLVHGDQVTARGRIDEVHGQQVLKASSIQSGGQRAQMAGQGGQSQGQRSQQGRQQTVSLSGEIDGFQKIRMQGARGDNLFVRLRLQDGSTRVIDLGQDTELSELSLSSGDRVRVEGTPKTLNGEPYLCADKLRVDGEPVDLERQKARQQQGRIGASGQGGQMGQLQGRLDGFKRVDLDAQGEHLFVRLRMQDGTTRVVDLGPSTSLSQLDLQQGDRLRVQGSKRQIDGQTVLVADRMRVDGEPVLSGRPVSQRDL